MDWLTFVSKIVDALAWPVSAAILLIFLFRNLERLSNVLKSVKMKDVEVNFRDKVAEIKAAAQDMNVTVISPKAVTIAGTFGQQANASMFVIDRSAEIEAKLHKWAKMNGHLNLTSTNDILKKLKSEKIVGDDIVILADQLFKLRNDVAHGVDFKIGAIEAVEISGIANSLNERLAQRGIL
ncbi:MAG: hypothetical protein ACRC7C_14495 [Beijerinckiaceae bacterium]